MLFVAYDEAGKLQNSDHRWRKLYGRAGCGCPLVGRRQCSLPAHFWALLVQLKPYVSLSVKCVFIFYFVAMHCFINLAKSTVTSPRIVMRWRESREGLPAGSQISMTGLQVLLVCYSSSIPIPSKNARVSADWPFCISWTNMWRCRWIISIWFCVIDLSEEEDLLPSRSSRCTSTRFQKSFAARTFTEWNSLSDSVTSLASVSSFRSQLSAISCP